MDWKILLLIYLIITISAGFLIYYFTELYRNSRPVGQYINSPSLRETILESKVPFLGKFIGGCILILVVFFLPTFIVLFLLPDRQKKRVNACYNKNKFFSNNDDDYFLVQCNCQYASRPEYLKRKSECERFCKKLNQ